MKQYVIREAYTDNYQVFQYVDGKLEVNSILGYYALEGYIEAIENMGYTRAYFVPEYEKEMQKAKEEYDFASEQFEKAKNSPLILNDEETKKFKKIAFIED